MQRKKHQTYGLHLKICTRCPQSDIHVDLLICEPNIVNFGVSINNTEEMMLTQIWITTYCCFSIKLKSQIYFNYSHYKIQYVTDRSGYLWSIFYALITDVNVIGNHLIREHYINEWIILGSMVKVNETIFRMEFFSNANVHSILQSKLPFVSVFH